MRKYFKFYVLVIVISTKCYSSQDSLKKDLSISSQELLQLNLAQGRFHKRDRERLEKLAQKKSLSIKDSMDILSISLLKNKVWKNLIQQNSLPKDIK